MQILQAELRAKKRQKQEWWSGFNEVRSKLQDVESTEAAIQHYHPSIQRFSQLWVLEKLIIIKLSLIFWEQNISLDNSTEFLCSLQRVKVRELSLLKRAVVPTTHPHFPSSLIYELLKRYHHATEK